MDRAELIAQISAANDEELKDVILKAAVRMWLAEGAKPEEIAELAFEIGEEYE